MMLPRCLFGALAILALLPAAVGAGDGPLSPDSRAVYESTVKPFLQTHCLKCHGEQKTLSGLRLDTLGTDFLSGKTGDVWREVYDRIGNRTMPPKKEARPDAAEALKVANWIIQELRTAEKRAKGMAGRIPTRRLNRTEYTNTLRDLFYLDENFVRALEQDLPMDGKVDGFDRGGAGLFIDGAQMAKYLETADVVLSRGVFAARPKPATSGRSFPREKIEWGQGTNKGEMTHFQLYPVGHPLQNSKDQVTLPLGANWVKIVRGGLEFVGTGYHGEGSIDFHGGTWHSWSRPWGSATFTDGWYRLRVRAGAFKGSGKHAVDEVRLWLRYSHGTPIGATESVVIDAPMDRPQEFELKIFLRAGTPDLPHSLRLGWNGGPGKLVINNPAYDKLQKEWQSLLNKNEKVFRKTPAPSAEEKEEAKKAFDEGVERYTKGMRELQVAYVFDPEVDLQAIPRLWIEWLEVDGPIGEWPPRGQTELLFDGDSRVVDESYLREIFARFLPRAYRRPVEPREIDAVVAWTLKAQAANRLSGEEAVREGVKMVLCSPSFLLLREPTGPSAAARRLNDHELACRLSYFLWSTMPDDELRRLADEGRLQEPGTLRGQVRRMIGDPKATAFVHSFAGQWLKVPEFSSVITDKQQYKYDDELRDSSRQEPYEFFKEVLQKDLSILNFVDSDFLMINGRLATHYGIDGVNGAAFRRVSIGAEHGRGGVLGMAGIMTYLTDGLRTLPVRRGAYVLDTLWNAPPPPPPPNVGDLPPVGKVKTVRERLELHRQSDSCASCHSKIDPFGMALENYDAIGAWRDRQNGERFKGGKNAPLLDVSGALPSGREFKSVGEFKQALMAEKEHFLRGFTEKMLAYALGRPVGATDRGTVDEILKTIGKDKYRMQSLIEAVVSTQAFQMK